MTQLREYLSSHRFRTLFTECLGWERANGTVDLSIDGCAFALHTIAEKRGLAVFLCEVHRTTLANRGLLRRIQRALIKRHHEHIVIYASDEPKKQVWQWAIHLEDGRRIRHREHPFLSSKPPDVLVTRLSGLEFLLSDEDDATLSDALRKAKHALDVTPEQELFSRFPSYAKRSDELAVAMRAGEPGAFDTFCEYHFRLAKKSSRMLLRWFGMEEDDAFQIACIGLVQAAKRFDPERGNQFSTLASHWIRQSCQRYGLESSNLIRIPVHAFWPLYRLQFAHRQSLAAFGLPQARYQFKKYVRQQGIRWVDWLTFERTREIRHFSLLFKDEVDSILERRDSIRDPLDSLLLEENANQVHAAISTLSSRKQEIIRLRYGMGCEEHTLEAVAQIFGLTRERIRQIQAWSEKKLKFLLSSKQDPVKENSLMTDAVPIESAIQEEEQKTEVSSDFVDFSAPISASVIEIPPNVDHDLELQPVEPRVTHPMDDD